MKESEVKTRLRAALEAHNENPSSLAKRFGVNQKTLNNQINSDTSVSLSTILLVAEALPDVSTEWLLRGGEAKSLNSLLLDSSDAVGAPYYDVDFQLGFDDMVAPSSENPEYLIRMPGYERATLWCNASGQSMAPEINNGDIIALQHIEDHSFLTYGDIYGIITTNGLRTIKRIGKSSHPNCYRLIPTNADYDEQDIPVDKILRVYRVLGAMKTF